MLVPEAITLLNANRLNLYIEDRKGIKDKYTSSKNYNDISIGIFVPSFLTIVVIGLDPSHPQIRNLTSMKSVPFVAFAGFLGLAFASAIYCKLTSTKMESLSLNRLEKPITEYSVARNIHAVFSCNVTRGATTSTVASSPTSSAIRKTSLAVFATCSCPCAAY